MAIATNGREATRHRWLVLAICTMSLFLVGLDATIVNVALPTIRTDLDASVSELQWVVDAYALVVASLLILGGSTGDRFGRARIFKVGLTLFALASLACSVAPTVELLIAFRALQAIGGSMLNPVAMSIIRNVFTDPRERAQAIGIWAGVIGISMALGPVLGGALVEGVGWRSIFWVNTPVCLLAFVLTARFVPESRAPRGRRFDPVGQLLVLALLASTTYAIIEAPAAGWESAQTLGLFALAAVLLAGLIVYEPRRTDPLIELRFFRSAPFSGATLIAVATFIGLSGFLFLTTLYLQGARGLSPLHAGLVVLPMAVTTLIGGPLTGRLIGRVGTRPSLVLGGAALSVSALMLTGLSDTTPIGWIVLAFVVFGVGFASVNPPITNTAVSGMPPSQAGVAAAIASTSRQIGGALGIAIVGALAVPAAGNADALAAASHTGWWILVGCGLLVVALAIVSTSPWAMGTAAALGDIDAQDREPLPSPAGV
jgi:EmrB/QacA subfamily drug resistance transporter